MSKITVAVIFGGRSSEHEISKISAMNVIASLSADKYFVLPIYITKDGQWLFYDGGVDGLPNVLWEKQGIKAVLSPDGKDGGLLRIVGGKTKTIPIDVVFPVLHGKYGEDGCVQGLCELAGVPYVGSGVLSSAVCMDKAFTKILVKSLNIPQAEHITVKFGDIVGDDEKIKETLKKIRYKIGYPCFVKPANSGSSIGISKAGDKEGLLKALLTAAAYDDKIIVEKAIKGRELECAVLGDMGRGVASRVGEIIPDGDFYDFAAKYEKQTETLTEPDLPEETRELIRTYAVDIFNALDCSGLARADFFWDAEKNKVYFNEINTMPGFTGISMYAMLWKEAGLNARDLVGKLIETALRRVSVSSPRPSAPNDND